MQLRLISGSPALVYPYLVWYTSLAWITDQLKHKIKIKIIKLFGIILNFGYKHLEVYPF